MLVAIVELIPALNANWDNIYFLRVQQEITIGAVAKYLLQQYPVESKRKELVNDGNRRRWDPGKVDNAFPILAPVILFHLAVSFTTKKLIS